jgi:hypothetical protein
MPSEPRPIIGGDREQESSGPSLVLLTYFRHRFYPPTSSCFCFYLFMHWITTPARRNVNFEMILFYVISQTGGWQAASSWRPLQLTHYFVCFWPLASSPVLYVLHRLILRISTKIRVQRRLRDTSPILNHLVVWDQSSRRSFPRFRHKTSGQPRCLRNTFFHAVYLHMYDLPLC